MVYLQWINPFSGSPAKIGVTLLKEDGTSVVIKEGDSIHFGDTIPVRVIGFRFSGRTEKEGAGQPTSIMYNYANNEKGECYISDDVRNCHTGYGQTRTGLELVKLV